MNNYSKDCQRELDYRLSKWILKNLEQLLEPDEIEEIWTELLSFYEPMTASVENVCGTLSDPLGWYQKKDGTKEKQTVMPGRLCVIVRT